MIDIQMNSEVVSLNSFPTWDFKVVGTIVPFLEGDNGDAQDAAIAAYIQTGTIQQLPTNGTPIMEFLTSQVGFGAVDGAIRTNCVKVGLQNYGPTYTIVNDNIKISMGKIA